VSDQQPPSVEERAEAERNAPTQSETVFQGRKFAVRVDTISPPNGSSYRREIVLHGGAVVMIPVDKDGNILLVKQWRRAVNRILVELPAGTLEKDEDPAECARRELQEETGYSPGKLTPLGGFFSAPGFCSEYLHLFLAEDLRESRLEADEHEYIELVSKSPEEAFQMIEQGQIQDAKSVAGITRYYLRQQLGIK
jgi:ADP-ribose pyrophosphatase